MWTSPASPGTIYPSYNAFTWFIESDIYEEDLLPWLHSISIYEPCLSGGDWTPLTSFLTHRAAIGKKLWWLRISDYLYMGEVMIECLERVVGSWEGECSDDDVYDTY